MSSVSNYKEEHRRGELEFILLAVDALHECVRPPAASGETPPTFHQNYLGNSERVLAVREASSACSSGTIAKTRPPCELSRIPKSTTTNFAEDCEGPRPISRISTLFSCFASPMLPRNTRSAHDDTSKTTFASWTSPCLMRNS